MQPQAPKVVNFRLLSEANAQRVADGEKTKGFRGVAYSGGPVRGFFGDMAIDLAGMQVKGDVPVLLNHDVNQIVGRAKLANDGTTLEITEGTFSAVTDEAKRVAALMDEGHPWELSIGANGALTQADRHKPTKLNGRSMALDSYMRDVRLLEVSFVPAGADPNAVAARLSAVNPQPNGADNMPGEQNPDLDRANARIAELEASNASLATQLATANASLAAQAKAVRAAAIERVFGKDAEITAEQRAAYEGMSDAQFSAMEVALEATRKGADPNLFRQTATKGRNEDTTSRLDAKDLPTIDGLPADPERAQLHAKILAHARENKVDYATAAFAVEGV